MAIFAGAKMGSRCAEQSLAGTSGRSNRETRQRSAYGGSQLWVDRPWPISESKKISGLPSELYYSQQNPKRGFGLRFSLNYQVQT
jgi:hypothetical protein